LFSRWVIGTWPLTTHSSLNISDVWSFAAELVRDLDLATLVVVSVGVNRDVPVKSVIELDQPKLLFSREDHAVTRMANLLADAIEEAMDVLDLPVNSSFVDALVKVSLGFASIRRINSDGLLDYRLARVADLDDGVKAFLVTTFSNIIQIPSDYEVLLKAPNYIRTDLVSQLSAMRAQDILDYMGFTVFVYLAPFLPKMQSSIRSLFLKTALGRFGPDPTDTSLLCFYAVHRLLPACFAKAALLHQRSTNNDVSARDWIQRLEAVFIEQLGRLTWVDNLSALLVRYRLRRNPVASFPETSAFGSDECVYPETAHHLHPLSPLQSLFDISILNQQRKLQTVLMDGEKAKCRLSGFDLWTEPKYDPTRQKVGLPLALFNSSVPSKSHAFAFHLSRVAVRFYRALLHALSENDYEHEIPFSLSEESQRIFNSLLDCLKGDFGQLPASLLVPTSQDDETQLSALLNQTAALQLSLEAFHQALHTRRIWNLDFRFEEFPELSADQLFFVYYALDNCESVGAVHVVDQDVTLPARYRVNLPLRHLDQFSSAFKCPKGSALSALYKCSVFGEHL
ncbi:unnamed protein product, partial [Ixodes hexagonus]